MTKKYNICRSSQIAYMSPKQETIIKVLDGLITWPVTESVPAVNPQFLHVPGLRGQSHPSEPASLSNYCTLTATGLTLLSERSFISPGPAAQLGRELLIRLPLLSHFWPTRS